MTKIIPDNTFVIVTVTMTRDNQPQLEQVLDLTRHVKELWAREQSFMKRHPTFNNRLSTVEELARRAAWLIAGPDYDASTHEHNLWNVKEFKFRVTRNNSVKVTH